MILKQFFAILVLALTLFLSSCSGGGYPNIPAQTAKIGEETTLVGWTPAPVKRRGVNGRLQTQMPQFKDAVVWYEPIRTRNLDQAVLKSARREGMYNIEFLSERDIDPNVLKKLGDQHAAREGKVYFVQGRRQGRASTGIFAVWYGSKRAADREPLQAGVHGFIAETGAFKALGGAKVLAVRYFMETSAADENMRDVGKLSPRASTAYLKRAFEAYGANFEGMLEQQMANAMMIQAMGIQMQTIQNMQSYNMAIMNCTDPSCNGVSMNGDGSWSADID